MFILDKLNISNIKSSDPSFSTQQNTYKLGAVAGIPGGISTRFLLLQFTLLNGESDKMIALIPGLIQGLQ
jgi:hypothetical protein